MLGNILLLFVLIACNAFFVSVEFAAITARKARIQLLADEGNQAARTVKEWLENNNTRDRLIAASQLGITMVSLALGSVGEKTFEELLTPLFHAWDLHTYAWITPVLEVMPLALALVIVTGLHVVLGEQVPKVATLYAPEKVALFSAAPMRLFSAVFRGFVDMLDWLTRRILSLMGLEMLSGHSLALSVEELRQVIFESQETGVIAEPEREMLNAIFDLKDMVVRQVTMPRTEMTALEADTPLEEVIAFTAAQPYSKYPVYEDTLDQIIGVLHVKEMLRLVQAGGAGGKTARDLARETLFVPDSIPVPALLREFRERRQHIAIVLDEFGGTAGLVTLEDLLEEIVGEVSDPFDDALPELQRLPDGSVEVDGLTLLEDVNEELELHLTDENYDTIAGYALGKLGHIPQAGETVNGEGVCLEVLRMAGRRIERLRLSVLPGDCAPLPDETNNEARKVG